MKPILFSGEMVRAILDGRKTQTRRVIKPQPSAGVRRSVFVLSGLEDGHGRELRCPYGRPGDTLWVRETWASHKYMDDTKPSEFTAGAQMLPVWYRADGVQSDERGKWRPSIFMPRWASRITLRVVDVRVEQVQDISEEDAVAEGVTKNLPDGWICAESHRMIFKRLWNSINGTRGYAWYTNPWVWVVEFEEVSWKTAR